jgi:hypothetical protein
VKLKVERWCIYFPLSNKSDLRQKAGFSVMFVQQVRPFLGFSLHSYEDQ